jgi:GntR family transcriptional repressor for pyruvate dehydrogenase complex
MARNAPAARERRPRASIQRGAAREGSTANGRLAVKETLAEHDRIYEALEARDPELARAASVTHVANVERWVRETPGPP